MRTAVAVDIGGSGIRTAVVVPAGRVSAVRRSTIDRRITKDELLRRIVNAVRASPVGGDSVIGVAVPSFVLPDGTIGPCPSVPALEGLNLGAALDGAHVVPDLAAATLGEAHHGAGRGISRFLCVALGTGANAAAAVDGVLVETAFGCLGDAGHVLVDPDGPECACGGRGCLEAIASGHALARDGAPFGFKDGRMVIDAARSGDDDAAALLERAGVALGRAIATWSVLVWPQVVAVGGGLSFAGELLLGPARRELARVGTPYVVSDVELAVAQLGVDAPLLGAGLNALASRPTIAT